ncbi:MAG: hypothetical protein ABI068_08795 [Ktedonobacterales bacterium]
MLEGVEREQRFTLRQDAAGGRWRMSVADMLVQPGEISRLTPPDGNIHQVRNGGGNLAISLHVYGADISVCGSIVNQCFDDLPLRTASDMKRGQPVGWRRA